MKPLSERWLGDVSRPPKGTHGRVFRLDLAPEVKPITGWRERKEYADGVIAPDGTAFARVRETGVLVLATQGVEALLRAMGEPALRVVYEMRDGEL